MNPLLEPASTTELLEVFRATPKLIPIGAGTKPRPAQVDGRFTRVSLRQLRGIVEYEPDEFTITALAGTPLSDLATALDAHGHYLPFDPLFREAGSTLGGAVAANANGPGRFKYGGVRDFILGVRFVDGAGRLLRMGGKVVKNAAGFDVSKFLVGSLGRFGVLVEITLKVFPRPISTVTVRLEPGNMDEALGVLSTAGNSRWQPDALDIPPGGQAVLLRLAGPPTAIMALAKDVLTRWPGRILADAEARSQWRDLNEVRWAPTGHVLLKTSVTLADVGPLWSSMHELTEANIHLGSGGNVAFISTASAEALAQLQTHFRTHHLQAVTWRGPAPLWLGAYPSTEISRAIKGALDPEQRFPGLDD